MCELKKKDKYRYIFNKFDMFSLMIMYHNNHDKCLFCERKV